MQRGDVKAEGSLMFKKELAKLEAQWQLKYEEIESSHADMMCTQDRTIALLQQQLNKAWATIEEADSTWVGECAADPEDPGPPDGASTLMSPEFGKKGEEGEDDRAAWFSSTSAVRGAGADKPGVTFAPAPEMPGAHSSSAARGAGSSDDRLTA